MNYKYYQLDWLAMPLAERQDRRQAAYSWALAAIKPGDRLYVAHCGGCSTFVMARWEHGFIVSKSGIAGIAPLCILRVNGQIIDNPGHRPV